MSGPAGVAWDDGLVAYDFGPGHPFAPVRLDLAMQLVRDLGLLDGEDTHLLAPVPVPEELLLEVHERSYVDAVRAASSRTPVADLARGLGTDDVPCFRDMHDVALRVCGATLAAAQAVHEGRALHAVNLAGGLHHAMPGAASGFCVYNDIGIAIRWLLAQGGERIAYVDVDVHHGDGVQAIFYDDPRVLTISLHETGRALFPGTGFAYETGAPGAEGTAVNVALPPGTADDAWLRAFDAVVPPLLEAFRPQVLVTQQGCDSHRDDPLAHLALTVDGQRASYEQLHRLAHRHTEGRWIATGGGGYSWVYVVPRAWAHLVGEVVGNPVDPEREVPAVWRELAHRATGEGAPLLMTDGGEPWFRSFDAGFDPDDRVDAAVLATREAVFPWHGLHVDHHAL